MFIGPCSPSHEDATSCYIVSRRLLVVATRMVKDELRFDVLTNIQKNMDNGFIVNQLNNTNILLTSYLGPDPNHNISRWYHDDNFRIGELIGENSWIHMERPDPIYSVWSLLAVSIVCISIGLFFIRKHINEGVKYVVMSKNQNDDHVSILSVDDTCGKKKKSNEEEKREIGDEGSLDSGLGFKYED